MVAEYHERLAEAMGDKWDTTSLAEEMKISYQAVRKVQNGGRFGTQNNAKAARILGVSSDWLATGKEPKAATAAGAPATGEKKGDFIKAPDALDLELQQHLHHLTPDDKQALIEQVSKLARERDAQRRYYLEEAGLHKIMEKAANSVRRSRHTASVSPRVKLPATHPAEPELPHIPPPYEDGGE